jgi:hypothetical protein
MGDIAKAERICPSFVGKVFRMALLAPDIVDAIHDGRQPATLTLGQLTKPFPMEWEEQRGQFLAQGRQESLATKRQ